MRFKVLIEAYVPAYRVESVDAANEEAAQVAAVQNCERMDSSDFDLKCPCTGYGSTDVLEPEVILSLPMETETAENDALLKLLLMPEKGGVQ